MTLMMVFEIASASIMAISILEEVKALFRFVKLVFLIVFPQLVATMSKFASMPIGTIAILSKFFAKL